MNFIRFEIKILFGSLGGKQEVFFSEVDPHNFQPLSPLTMENLLICVPMSNIWHKKTGDPLIIYKMVNFAFSRF